MPRTRRRTRRKSKVDLETALPLGLGIYSAIMNTLRTAWTLFHHGS
jgi:hypothetical protein